MNRKNKPICNPPMVERRKGENIDRLINRFRKKVKESEVLYVYKQHQFFEKPSHIRRRKRGESETRKKMEQKRKIRTNRKRTKYNPDQ